MTSLQQSAMEVSNVLSKSISLHYFDIVTVIILSSITSYKGVICIQALCTEKKTLVSALYANTTYRKHTITNHASHMKVWFERGICSTDYVNFQFDFVTSFI